MKIHIGFDEEGYAASWGSSAVEGVTVEMEIDENHSFFSCTMAHRLENGGLIFSEERKAWILEQEEQNAPPASPETRIEQLEQVVAFLVNQLTPAELTADKEDVS